VTCLCYHPSMRRVLLVDDSKVTRDALQAALEPYGFEVQQAENGASALLQLRNSSFDLAFVDLNMPVVDGPTLVRLMKAQGIATKVILVTVGAATPVVAATIRLGASDYVAKPFTPEAIRLATARALGLDIGQLRIRPSRVLLQHPDDALSARLRALLPPHVELTAAPALTRILEVAERVPHDVVLLDARVLEGEVTTAAELVRQSLPDAAVFAIAAGAPPEAHWSPQGSLDGTLPVALDEEVVRGFLYPNFLRPLVFVEGSVFHAAGFEGSEKYLAAYFAALARAIFLRCSRQAPTSEPSIDLTRAPPFPGRIAELAAHLRTRLEERGTTPSFRVAPALVANLTARPDLRQVVIFA
jgi:CheY-like chemotaxis protein